MLNGIVKGSSSNYDITAISTNRCVDISQNDQQEIDQLLKRKRKNVNYAFLPESFYQNMEKGVKNGRWSLEEHKRFILGVLKYGNNWKEIVKEVKTRTCAQARSHSQKFFSKLQKLHIEGITDDMMNVRKLHDMYLTISKKEFEPILILLTDVAHEKIEGSCLLEEIQKQEEKSKESMAFDNIPTLTAPEQNKIFEPDDKKKLKKSSSFKNDNSLSIESCTVKESEKIQKKEKKHAVVKTVPEIEIIECSKSKKSSVNLKKELQIVNESELCMQSFPHNNLKPSKSMQSLNTHNTHHTLASMISCDDELFHQENEYTFDLVNIPENYISSIDKMDDVHVIDTKAFERINYEEEKNGKGDHYYAWMKRRLTENISQVEEDISKIPQMIKTVFHADPILETEDALDFFNHDLD